VADGLNEGLAEREHEAVEGFAAVARAEACDDLLALLEQAGLVAGE
jgi:hypothetical protein